MTKDEALKLALEALEICAVRQEHQWDGLQKVSVAKAAIKQALAAPVQEPVGEVVVESMGVRGSDAMRVRMHFYKEIPPVGSKIYTTPPNVATPLAAPDLQAELEATNRQVEILSDALAESQREVAALKAVQEPVATIDSLEQEIYENTREFVPLNVMEWLLKRLNTTPPAAQRQWVGLTDEEQDEIAAYHGLDCMDYETAFRAIEAKLKEKNNG